MNDRVLFLRWWLFVMFVAVIFVIAFVLGIFHEIWDKDVTKLSFFILIAFVLCSVWCGVKTFFVSFLMKDSKDNKIVIEWLRPLNKKKFEAVHRNLDIGWFVSDTMLSVGMVGTLVGFILMFAGGFTDIDVENVASMQKVIQDIAYGMSTALYTTLVGLVCSTLLKVQYFNLSHTVDPCFGNDNDKT